MVIILFADAFSSSVPENYIHDTLPLGKKLSTFSPFGGGTLFHHHQHQQQLPHPLFALSLSESVIQGLMIVNVLHILVPCVVLIKPQSLSVSGPRYLQQRQMTNENKSMTCHRGGDTTQPELNGKEWGVNNNDWNCIQQNGDSD